MRGRKPDPEGVRAAKAPVRTKRKKSEPAAIQAIEPAAVADPPEGDGRASYGLKGRALEIWNKWTPRLRQARMLRQTDEPVFARYCRNFAKWEQLRDGLDKRGYVYETRSLHGTLRRIDPAFAVADRLERHLLAIEDRFGLNPAERQRLVLQRAQAGGKAGDLFPDHTPATPREDDPAAGPTPPAEGLDDDSDGSPIGALLN